MTKSNSYQLNGDDCKMRFVCGPNVSIVCDIELSCGVSLRGVALTQSPTILHFQGFTGVVNVTLIDPNEDIDKVVSCGDDEGHG